MEIAGLPLHPLVVHAVVVFAPLAAVGAIAYALLPRWRWALRVPVALVVLIAVVTAFVATLSGESLLESRPELGQIPSLQTHQDRGELLRNLMFALAITFGLGAWRLGGPSALKSERGARVRHGGVVDLAVSGLVLASAVGVLVMAVLTGDSGARSVWG